MATWSDLAGYVRSNYKIADENSRMIKMVFETGNLRSQLVFLWRQSLMDGGEEWVQIESPIAEVGSLNPRQVLEEVGNVVCGGAAVVDGHVVLRHAVPLLNLNVNEFERPLILVTSTADHLEHKLVGSDKY
jgi:hypothetical protein